MNDKNILSDIIDGDDILIVCRLFTIEIAELLARLLGVVVQ